MHVWLLGNVVAVGSLRSGMAPVKFLVASIISVSFVLLSKVQVKNKEMIGHGSRLWKCEIVTTVECSERN